MPSSSDYGPVPVDFSWLERLVPSYEAGQKRYREDQFSTAVQDLFSKGELDAAKLTQLALLAGKTGNITSLRDIGALLPIVNLNETNKAAADFSNAFGGGQPLQSPQPPPQSRPMVGPQSGIVQPTAAGLAMGDQPRPVVASTPQVVGDEEAIARGLYEPDVAVGGGQKGSGGPPSSYPTPPPTTPPVPAPQQVPTRTFVPPQTPSQQLMSPAPMATQPQPQFAPPMPSVTANPAAQNIPALIRAAANPKLPPSMQATAKALLEHALKSSDLPTEQKDYLLYRSQGGTKPFVDYQLDLKRAGATLINTAEGEQAAQSKARVAIDTEAVKNLAQSVAQGHTVIPLLDQVIEIANKTPGGWAGKVSPAMARAASALGLQVPEGWSNAELLNSISRQLIPGVRDPGSTSNLEQEMYAQAVPGLTNSVEGRVKLATMFKALQARKAEVLQVYRENIGSLNLHQKLIELDQKPLFNGTQLAAIAATNSGFPVADNATIKKLRDNAKDPAFTTSFAKHFGEDQMRALLSRD